MITGKVPAIQKPTALGTLLQAATYGMTIPTIFGTTRAALSAIWAQNLRQGKCRGKKYKGKKKGVPNYVESVDFLLGSNPIEGVLQSYLNGGKYALNFLRVETSTGNPGLGPASYTFTDPDFYFLLAVTAEIASTGYFNDFGSPNYNGVGKATIAAAGTGYAVNDTFAVNGTTGAQAIGTVTSIGTGGAVTGFTLGAIGSGYSGGTQTTTKITGAGAGLTVNVTHLGVPYNDTSEYPLWNTFQHGPDLADAAAQKFYPYCYYWAPGSTVIEFAGANLVFGGIPAFTIPGGTGNFFIYYAQLSSQAEFEPPVTAACLTFEPSLGDGPEYTSPKDFSAQQIIYNEYAGAGSSDIDLGASATIPQISLEVRGSHARWHPRGDADFADMIEDIVKSGLMQTGSELGLVQRGVNCNDLPGPVDKFVFVAFEPKGSPAMRFMQPVAKGQIMFAAVLWNGNPDGNTSNPTISDVSGQTWIPIITGNDNVGFWYAIANANIAAGNKVTASFHSGFGYDACYFGWVLDPASTGLDGTPQTLQTSGGGTASLSITTSGPALLVAFCAGNYTGSGASQQPPNHWTDMFPNGPRLVAYRRVAAAGTYTFSTPIAGASGAFNVALLAIKNSAPSGAAPYPKALGNILDKPSLDAVRAQCQAAGLIGSLVMNAQKDASEWLIDLYKAANADPVWSGFVLKSIAKSEQSAVGYGRVYTAPTASGPVATLTESNLVGDASKPLVTISREAQTDTDNVIQAQFYDRNSDYNPSTASEPLGGAVAILGPRKQSPQDMPMIQDPAVARMQLAMQARRWSMLRNKYSFAVKPNFFWLEAGDLAAINDSKLGIVNLPVRLTSVKENDDGSLDCEADPFVWGCNAPNPGLGVTSWQGYSAGSGGDPGGVNTPIFIEAVPRLSGQSNQGELWIAVSGASPNYGGCAVLISTDAGASYNPAPGKNGQNAIQGSAITGATTADWPAATDPDAAHDLSVDLTESLGSLETYAAADRDNFTYPFFVAGGTASIPYELGAYDIATLTSAYKYTLPATGGGTNDLRRGVWGAPGPTVGVGVDHPSGSRFCFLGNPNSPVGIFKLAIDPAWIGKTLYFKFLAFNQQGNNLQAQSAATAYSFAPTGLPAQLQNPNQNYTVSGGALTQPTSTTVDMAQATATFPSNQANYNARAFTIPAPSVNTTYYVTIYDPAQLGDTGSATNLSAFCETSATKWNTPGYIRIGQIVALPGGGGSGGGGGIGNITTLTVNGN